MDHVAIFIGPFLRCSERILVKSPFMCSCLGLELCKFPSFLFLTLVISQSVTLFLLFSNPGRCTGLEQ